MWFLFRYHVVVLTPAYMLALKRPHILWSIGRSVDRGVVIIPAHNFKQVDKRRLFYLNSGIPKKTHFYVWSMKSFSDIFLASSL